MSILIRLNAKTRNLDAPIVPNENISVVVPYEESAYDHWLFDRGENSVFGRVNGHELKPSNSVGVTYAKNSVQINLAQGANAALIAKNSEVQESGASLTVCYVYKRPVIEGVYSIDTTPIGHLLSYSDRLNVRNERNDIMCDMSSPLFIAVSVDAASNKKTVALSNDGLSFTSWDFKGFARSYLGIGNMAYVYNDTDTTPHDYYEYIIFDRALTEEEITNVYKNSQARMCKRGINI